MRIDLQRVGEVANLTATGSPEEIASLFQLTGFQRVQWWREPRDAEIQVFGTLKDAELGETVQEDDGA